MTYQVIDVTPFITLLIQPVYEVIVYSKGYHLLSAFAFLSALFADRVFYFLFLFLV